ncbi:MAG: di-trans,poly-cis-decaprenylcistransferase [Malacoplasma sp.]|nr:di-trans,poly-cis-decaprenylcistransferase [Malacoplasma sp.]
MAKTLNHVAFIMDGNGRWAKQRNKQRTYGHMKGVKIIQTIVKEAIGLKIPFVSFFAFSTENWNRPIAEVNFLLKLLNGYLTKKTINSLIKNNVRVRWIGFEENISKNLVKKIKNIEMATEKMTGINVCIFFNYGGIQDIENALKLMLKNNQQNDLKNIKQYLLTKDLPPIDLLIRTSGEKRISNFALYDLAYTEIIFEPTLWPDYTKNVFLNNINEYNNRNRRFGNLDDK